ncbi:hypothetical protein E2C01_074896 [Portunus trituberculatus]|uniref:Uncharacterized protein n=1 Tax=Portunus trituberculatus TaxID=210409 RepID=A0A5B7IEQ9_PORTR|nr:hypothetical protein [Portunus trituberculatus]
MVMVVVAVVASRVLLKLGYGAPAASCIALGVWSRHVLGCLDAGYSAEDVHVHYYYCLLALTSKNAGV